MKYLTLLLCLLVAACGGPAPESASPPSATRHIDRPMAARSWPASLVGFDTICRGG